MNAAAVIARLGAIAGLSCTHDAAACAAASGDFGGLVRGEAFAVVRPHHVEALLALVAFARAEGLSLTPRTLGLSQSGQSLPVAGVSVDMSGFVGIDVDADAGVVRCGAGTTWRQLLAATAPRGLAPQVMPFNLDLSVGGVLSAGGLGSTSHRWGMSVSSVEALTAVTGAGELVHADRSLRPEVFEAMLGGQGQFGLLCHATLRLRALAPRTRTWVLLYDELGAMLADQRRVADAPWCVHLEGFAAAAIAGLKQGPGGRRMPFARWFGGLHLSSEHDGEAGIDEGTALRGLQFRERLLVEDSDSVEYAARYDARFAFMRATGAWAQSHPWFECMVPADAAAALLPELVPQLPLLLGDGHRVMPIAEVPVPGFVMRPAGPVTGLAILPVGVPEPARAPALAALRELHARLLDAGAKRYLSGWLFEPDEAAWRRHFGARYEAWRARKHELDPHGLLRSVLLPG